MLSVSLCRLQTRMSAKGDVASGYVRVGGTTRSHISGTLEL